MKKGNMTVPLLVMVMLSYYGMRACGAETLYPAEGPARVFGETNAGCIQGASALPLDGSGYDVMHQERSRYFGHPDLIAVIRHLGARVAQHDWGRMHVGDLSLARGGPMPSGHRSHQNGLDADIWYTLRPDMQFAPSLLMRDQRTLERSSWREPQAELLKAASQLPDVDRIFVHASIKKALCEDARYRHDRHWLRKIRPWYRHDDHFHLRLSCPEGSAGCVAQEPVPAGDGCDASLDWWLQQPALPPLPSEPLPYHGPQPRLPPACDAILHARKVSVTRSARAGESLRK
ncbi:MAG: hypothetical protein RIQ52_1592 [Pseudomonadota bacterium]|jgi:penicillin-insensitive murein endopeptidase